MLGQNREVIRVPEEAVDTREEAVAQEATDRPESGKLIRIPKEVAEQAVDSKESGESKEPQECRQGQGLGQSTEQRDAMDPRWAAQTHN